ncbi:MAG: glycosyltransferase, partial [Synergistaceae bacterium]|nr:glycosyltransferase [Synergistaceae bacterium]
MKELFMKDEQSVNSNLIKGGEQSEKISAVYATNAAIHHTENLCEAFIKNEAVKNFRLIITESLSDEYKNLGLSENFENDFTIDARKNRQAAIDAINNADLMIGTYYVKDLMKDRVSSGKLTFIASERIFKPYSSNFFINAAKNFARFFKYKILLTKYQYYKENVRFLLIGSRAPSDYIKLGVKKENILKFGYFPAICKTQRKNYCTDEVIHLLWVGRLISWKHPEYAVRVCKYLTEKRYKIDVKIIGNGSEEASLKNEAQGCENIQFLGGLPTEKVRKIMSESDVFLFTSNQAEGWGLVLH